MSTPASVEPSLINERTAAAVLSLSQSAFAVLVRRGDIQPIAVPGMRRKVYALDEVRALARRWGADRDVTGRGSRNE